MAKVGETVNIQYKLKEAVPGSVFPVTTLEEPDGTPISTVNLTHTTNGSYVGSFTMPNSDVKLYSIPYKEIGHTNEDPLYDHGEGFVELENVNLDDINTSIISNSQCDTLSIDLIDDEVLSVDVIEVEILTVILQDCEG